MRILECSSGLPAVLCAGAVLLLAGPWNQPKDEITGSKFVLKDSQGKVRCCLDMTSAEKNSPGLVFYDSRGRKRIFLSLLRDEMATLVLLDKEERAAAQLGIGSEGPFLHFIGSKGELLATVQANLLGEVGFYLNHESGTTAFMEIEKDGDPTLQMHNLTSQKSGGGFSIIAGREKTECILLRKSSDDKVDSEVRISASSTAGPRLDLLGKEEKPILSLPKLEGKTSESDKKLKRT